MVNHKLVDKLMRQTDLQAKLRFTAAPLNQAINEYIQWYNTERIEQRLRNLTAMQDRNQTLEPPTA